MDHRVGLLDPVFEGITYLATAGVVWVAAALVLAWRAHRPVVPVGLCAGACVWGADLASNLVKAVTNRPRPYAAMPHLHTLVSRPATSSFPSGHAATAFAGAVVLSMLRPRLWPVFFGAATLVAVSRVYVGVHYPSDVIAGAALGAGFAAAVLAIVERLHSPATSRRRKTR